MKLNVLIALHTRAGEAKDHLLMKLKEHEAESCPIEQLTVNNQGYSQVGVSFFNKEYIIMLFILALTIISGSIGYIIIYSVALFIAYILDR